MVFITVEIQSTGNEAAMLTNTFVNRNEAESDFHRILTSAAVSTVPIHSAILITDTGKTLETKTYEHVVTGG